MMRWRVERGVYLGGSSLSIGGFLVWTLPSPSFLRDLVPPFLNSQPIFELRSFLPSHSEP